MPSNSNRFLLLLLSFLLLLLLGGGVWLVQRGLRPVEDQRSPTVVQAMPTSTEAVSRATPIEFVFDQQMDRPSVEAALSAVPAFPYDLEWSSEGAGDRLVVRPRDALAWDTRYQISVGTEALNQAGRPLEAAASVAFTTADEVNVTDVTPGSRSETVDVNQPITVRFDRPLVEVGSLEAQDELPQPLLINPPVEGIGRWLAADLYGFYPSEGLSRGTAYEITVSPVVVPGVELPASFEWSFVTEGPRVAASFPFDGASEVASATAIRLLFAQPMDRASVEGNFQLSAQGADVPVAGSFRWESDDTLLFVPAAPLDAATSYEVEVAEGATAEGAAVGWPARSAPCSARWTCSASSRCSRRRAASRSALCRLTPPSRCSSTTPSCRSSAWRIGTSCRTLWSWHRQWRARANG